MHRLKGLVERYPVLSYVALCYAITWGVWFCIPLATGQWTLIKILVGIGLGPGLAAVLLDRIRGTAGPVTSWWWACFAVVFLAVAVINVSSLLTGDAPGAEEFAAVEPPGLTALGVTGSLLAAAVAGLIFASAARSRARTLCSIVSWRVPLRWWLAALFVPAALALLGLAYTYATSDYRPPSVREGLPVVTWAWYSLRSILFTFLVVAIGEETGWRGWMLPELQKRFSPLNSSLLLGVVWGFWHFPLWIIGAYPGPPDAVVEYVFLGPVMAILFTWLYNRTGGNLLLALVLHTAINNTHRVVPGSDIFPALLLALVITLIFTEKMWRRRGAETSAPAC